MKFKVVFAVMLAALLASSGLFAGPGQQGGGGAGYAGRGG
jgi:hypothetical protein